MVTCFLKILTVPRQNRGSILKIEPRILRPGVTPRRLVITFLRPRGSISEIEPQTWRPESPFLHGSGSILKIEPQTLRPVTALPRPVATFLRSCGSILKIEPRFYWVAAWFLAKSPCFPRFQSNIRWVGHGRCGNTKPSAVCTTNGWANGATS